MFGLAARLSALFRRFATDAELDEELRYHLDRETERHVALGLSPRDAGDAARRALGNLTVHAESARGAYGWVWLEQIVQDASYGWRALRRSRGFTAVAALSLALGIGANTMIFGVTYSLLYEPLPVTHPERLVSLGHVSGNDHGHRFSSPEIDAMRGSRIIAGITATRSMDNIPVVANGERTFITLDLVDGSYYATIGLDPYRGRVIDAADVDASAPVAFISQPFAERMFGSAERALGQTVRVNDRLVSIIGVARAAFRGLNYPGSFAIAVPLTLEPALGFLDELHSPDRAFGAVARVAHGATVTQTEQALDGVFRTCCPRERPERLTTTGMISGIAGGKDDARADYAPLLYILLAGAGVVLLIACANVGSLLLVRASAREREIAVRLSLGASRGRVVRQLLTESLILGVLGGVLALPFAAWGTLGVERLIPAQMSVYADIVRWHVKPALLAFTSIVSLVCVVMFGLVPAVRATRPNLVASLKAGGRGTLGIRRRWLDRGVVVAQLALALLLITAASLLTATLRNIARVDGGFASSGVTTVGVETRGTPYGRAGIVPLQDEILRRVRAIPGIEQAGMSTNSPIAGGRNIEVGLDDGGAPSSTPMMLVGATPDYLGAMGIHLVAGRDFATHDDSTAESVAIVSERVARQAFADRNPLGAMLRLRGDTTHVMRVVGVARDTRMFGLRDERSAVVYAPVTQTGYWPFLGLAVRMPDDQASLTRQVTRAVEQAAPGVRVRRVSTMRTEVRESMFAERMAASIAMLFGGLALLLATIGIYGVIAFNVARRTNELGVRMALGARRIDIVALVLRGALALVAIGVIIGAPLAFFAGRALRAQLYGVSAHDPILLLSALGTLVLVALVAAMLPARRAARIDPLVALRMD